MQLLAKAVSGHMASNNNRTSTTRSTDLQVTVPNRDNDVIVNNLTVFYVQVVVFVALSGLVSLFGIVANIINIMIFIRQGSRSNSTSASLLSLAVADLLCVVYTVFTNCKANIDFFFLLKIGLIL